MARRYVEYRRVREQIEGDADTEFAVGIATGTATFTDDDARTVINQLLGAVERGVKLGSLARSTRNRHYRAAQLAEARAVNLERRLAQIGRVVNDGLIAEDPAL